MVMMEVYLLILLNKVTVQLEYFDNLVYWITHSHNYKINYIIYNNGVWGIVATVTMETIRDVWVKIVLKV